MNNSISREFTVDDIHLIRENNYERTKNMTIEEKMSYYNSPRTGAESEIEKRKALSKEVNDHKSG